MECLSCCCKMYSYRLRAAANERATMPTLLVSSTVSRVVTAYIDTGYSWLARGELYPEHGRLLQEVCGAADVYGVAADHY